MNLCYSLIAMAAARSTRTPLFTRTSAAAASSSIPFASEVAGAQEVVPASVLPSAFVNSPAPLSPLLGSINLSPDPTSSSEQLQTEITTGVRLGGKVFLISSGGGSTLQICDGTDPAAISLIGRTDLGGYTSQSVASHGTLLAVVLSPSDYATHGGRGLVRFYRVRSDGSLRQLAEVPVGYLPDSISFNRDGSKLLIANEGEPTSGYASDPAGSIGIIDISGGGWPDLTYTELSFAELSLPAGVRISGPIGTTQVTDVEPEFITVIGDTAYATLQENNAVVRIDLKTNSIDRVFPLGAVDYSSLPVDLSDKDGVGGISTFAPKLGQPFEGLRMPDGIAAYRVRGRTFFVTANEGDGRDGSAYSDELRGSGSGQDLTAYRVKRLADDASAGSLERTTTFGARSISVFDGENGALLWDSGNTLQTIAVAAGLYDDGRSDDKGVEPEGIVIARVGGRRVAIVGMERAKATLLAVFDITNPSAGQFVTSTVVPGGLSPEGLHVIPASKSGTGRAQLVVSNEVSNTLDVLDLETLIATPAVGRSGTFQATMLKDAEGGTELTVSALFTVGEFSLGLTRKDSVYAPPGILDGLGAYDNGDGTFTVLANHEMGASVGYPYRVLHGTAAGAATTPMDISGARISKFIVDKDMDDDPSNGHQPVVIKAGLAYRTVIGSDSNGFDRFCSSTLFEAGQFGRGRGLANRLYITGEESSGALYVLDPVSSTLREAPALGKGSWENVALVDTGSASTVGLVLFDDTRAPLYLWVGTKKSSGDLLDRNGLRQGNLYVWAPDADVIPEAGTDATPGPDSDDLRAIASGTPLAGHWQLLGNQNAVIGKTAAELRAAAVAAGAMQFSRPEDGDTNPLNGQQVVFNTTGNADFGGGDSYGNVIRLDFAAAFAANGQLADGGITTLQVIYDGDKLSDPTVGLRSPDNLAWSADGHVYVQEDRTVSPWGSVDGSIWKLSDSDVDPVTGQAAAERWAVIDRQTPYGQTDALAIGAAPTFTNAGEWESSGILDVSSLYDEAPGSLFLADVQAHGLRDGNIWGSGYLAEGGQLNFMQQPAS